MKQINVVVGFTPFHALFAERLLPHLSGDTYCLFTKGWPKASGFKRVGFFKRGNKLVFGLCYLFSILCLSFYFRVWLFRKCSVSLYAPHPCSVFSNYLFFSKRVASVNVYEDGLLNYYDVASSRARIPAFLKFLGFISGLPVKEFDGHLAGYDARRVDRLYVSRAAAVVAKSKVGEVIQLSGQGEELTPIPRRILFLDQNVDNFLSSEQRARAIAKMFELYPLEGCSYFYKGHHDYCPGMEGMVVLKEGLSTAPAESVVMELCPEVVISFYSSALLNIASLYPDLECVSLAACFVRVTRDEVPMSLASIFEEAKVVCLGCKEDAAPLLN